jgi:hypothetical protein
MTAPHDESDAARAAIALDLPWQFIQALRLAHAIMESEFEVHVPETEANKFAYLRRFFDVEYHLGTAGVASLPQLSLVHRARDPVTAVGAVRRPLIFPHTIVRYCRERWAPYRNHRFSFAGNLPPARRAALERWSANAGGRALRFRRSPWQRGLARLIPGYQEHYRQRRTGLTVWPTRRGREWPVKAWDDRYFDVLCRSEFVICPNGDYIWTYRFFEATLCGAIPVVEESCGSYAGFEYHHMSDDPRALRWSPEVAERNYARCVALLTVPPEELNRELRRLLSLSPEVTSDPLSV